MTNTLCVRCGGPYPSNICGCAIPKTPFEKAMKKVEPHPVAAANGYSPRGCPPCYFCDSPATLRVIGAGQAICDVCVKTHLIGR